MGTHPIFESDFDCLTEKIKKWHRDQVNSDHRIRNLLDRSMNAAHRLDVMYLDEDQMRKEEINKIAGPNEFTEFYSRLRAIKEFHRIRPEDATKPLSFEFEQMNIMVRANEDLPSMVEFSDEEGYGRFLDLHEHYNQFLNIKGIDRCDYLEYLTHFDKLFEIPKEKKNSQYREYANNLLQYLYEYAEKVKPLIDWNEDLNETKNDFEKQWNAAQFPGWTDAGSAMKQTGAHLDLSQIQSAEELASLGLDRLKSALMALGLKCGGTLEARAQRLFSTKGKGIDDIDATLFAKKRGKPMNVKTKDSKKEIAYL